MNTFQTLKKSRGRW